MENLERKLANLCWAGGIAAGIAGALIASGLSMYDTKLGEKIGTQIVHGGSYAMMVLLCAGSYFGSRSTDLDKKEKD